MSRSRGDPLSRSRGEALSRSRADNLDNGRSRDDSLEDENDEIQY